MIETVRQAPGRWDLELTDPPDEIKALTSRAFAALIVTPTRVDANAYTTATLLGLSQYTGILTARSSDRTALSGYGPAWLLTLAKQVTTANVSSRPLYDGTNTSWIRTNILRLSAPENNGLTVGTITSAAAPSKTGKVKSGQTPLAILNDVCRRFSREWRVNPNGTLDVGTIATLYPTYTTPTAIATPIGGGRDLNIAGLPAVDFNETDDWDEWTSTVTCNDNDETHSGTDTIGSNPYVNPFDTSAVVSRKIVTSSTADTDADCATIATLQLSRFDDPTQDITLTSDTYSISDDVEAGDYIWCYDVDNELYDATNEVYYQGRTLHPVKVRVRAVRKACTSQLGYYLLSWDGSAQEVHDLTPYVKFEPPGVALELGHAKRHRPRPRDSME